MPEKWNFVTTTKKNYKSHEKLMGFYKDCVHLSNTCTSIWHFFFCGMSYPRICMDFSKFGRELVMNWSWNDGKATEVLLSLSVWKLSFQTVMILQYILLTSIWVMSGQSHLL